MSAATPPETPVDPDLAERLVVTGAGGLLGHELRRLAPTARAFGHRELDITDAESVRAIVGPGAVIINCAAFTNVDAAETEQTAAFAANETGPAVLAAVCAQVGARLIHISTDYVFDGAATRPYETTDDTAPLSVYGQSKLAGEHAVLGSAAQAHVVRTSWVFRAAGGDFVATMLKLESERDTIDVVDDQLSCPTYGGDLALGLLELARTPQAPRLLHATNAGTASRFDLAQAAFAGVGADPDRVRPCDSSKFPRPARRPAYSVLSGASWADAGLTPLRDWRSALDDALSRRSSYAGPL
ncbi:dTDP-4-dehydrorhamnose reductase [Nocardia cyriacigeorgica]|uniref:dTDP-4-dehydrorhamnose reductase n=1 Tax=Nocardia cyriacigeorgica TaxID=135487 RepID=A0A4U8W376_9NOCA|nr:dTDP-4-dehydrorhamnose reductase [Nocardia cyriacigeorgica]VFA99319.1 dTDP-4-dehydrorhamnose reductase [Nocardia cyriacigeorgica]